MFKTSFLALAALFADSAAQAETLYGLTTDNRLLTFDTAAPTQGTAIALSGLASSEKLLGLDARPISGQLYTLSNLGNLYTLDASTGAATFVAALKAPINGSLLGFDFNPNADVSGAASLRVLTAAGDNYAVNVNPGANLGAVTKQTNVSSASGALKLTGFYRCNYSLNNRHIARLGCNQRVEQFTLLTTTRILFIQRLIFLYVRQQLLQTRFCARDFRWRGVNHQAQGEHPVTHNAQV